LLLSWESFTATNAQGDKRSKSIYINLWVKDLAARRAHDLAGLHLFWHPRGPCSGSQRRGAGHFETACGGVGCT